MRQCYGYDVLLAVNRHTITPNGWVQEEDNQKLDRKAAGGARLLAEEIGLNSYQCIQGYDCKPARDYLARTHDYWRAVRAEWAAQLHDKPSFSVRPKINGHTLFDALFDQADAPGGKSRTPEELRAAVRRTMEPSLAAPRTADTARARPRLALGN